MRVLVVGYNTRTCDTFSPFNTSLSTLLYRFKRKLTKFFGVSLQILTVKFGVQLRLVKRRALVALT